MDGPAWGTFTVGGAWLCTHLWEHYQYTLDTAYLRSIYPVIKGAALFFQDFLVQHPNGKWLVTNPSTSPENFPASPGNGPFFDEQIGSTMPGTTICAGSSIDMQILTDLFADCIQAATTLGVDQDWAQQIASTRARLAPPQIGKDGTLQEWVEDWGQLEKQHRHQSPMYGLYPGNVLSIRKTPELIDACKNFLNKRGDEAGGWCRAWKTALWARLHDGNRAYKIFKGYLKDQAGPQLFARAPMQVDATMGAAAAISEMLVQSQEGMIELLPALPDEWKEGSFDGVCTRNAFELKMKWAQSRIQRVELLSRKGQACRIHVGSPVKVTAGGKKVNVKVGQDGTLEFPTVKGGVYVLTVINK
jgi:alpha-L-fucosidase 2